MALSKEAPEFDVDDEVLLMEPGIVLEDKPGGVTTWRGAALATAS